MILLLTLAGILTTQPVDKVFDAGTYFAYRVGTVLITCPGAHVSLTGSQATVTAAACERSIFWSGFEQ